MIFAFIGFFAGLVVMLAFIAFFWAVDELKEPKPPIKFKQRD